VNRWLIVGFGDEGQRPASLSDALARGEEDIGVAELFILKLIASNNDRTMVT
jgi:hypothetical protein